MNVVQVNYIGGEERYLGLDICPVDKLVLLYNSKKSSLTDGACKETCELAYINSKLMFESDQEENAKALLKEIFDFLEGVEKYLKRMKNINNADHKIRDIGGKYTFVEAHSLTNRFIN
jgi:hypothetical protein